MGGRTRLRRDRRQPACDVLLHLPRRRRELRVARLRRGGARRFWQYSGQPGRRRADRARRVARRAADRSLLQDADRVCALFGRRDRAAARPVRQVLNMLDDATRLLEAAKTEHPWPRPPLWVVIAGVALAALLVVYPFVFATPFAHHLM